MAVSAGFRSFVMEQLQRLPSIAARAMFGAAGLYAEGYFFAVIDDDRLYLKVDDSNRTDYENAGMEPFRPYGDERAMQYYEVPVEVLEDRDALEVWAGKAIDVARSAKRRKRRP